MSSNYLKILFAGTPQFAAAALQALLNTPHEIIGVYTQPDRPQGRGQKLAASPVKLLAQEYHLPVYQPVSLKDPLEQQKLASLQADVMVVAAYGLILPAAVLTAPRLGCINIHSSLLPRWRGAAPIQRAILAGDKKTGVTIMQMDAGLDTGAMLYKTECDISAEETSETLHDKLAKQGAEAIVQTLNLLMQDKLAPEIQNSELATYAHKIQKEEAQLDWQAPAIELERKVRAFNPWPVAFTPMGDQFLRIWQAEVVDRDTKKVEPGTILQVAKSGIDVATGDGVLRLLVVQPPGGRAMKVSDFVNARRAEVVEGKMLTASTRS